MIVQGEGVMEWVAERNSADFGRNYAAIGQVLNDKLVAGVVFDNFNGNNVVGTIAVDSPPTIKFWVAVFGYAFETLDCLRVTAYVEERNEKSIKLLKKMGFEKESVMEMAAEDGTDVIIFRMWKAGCRMLNWRK
jgi:RimJ/RimL family protein N-acetyltransferase